ncbi:hypothetical protein VaNZ11_000308, partial [Volvox africanus]
MNSNTSSATSSARESRRTLGPSGCARRAARNASHQITFVNWYQQRQRQRPAGRGDPSPGSLPSSFSTTPDEDFLLRARKMQRRIAKLKQLQERLTQLKEEESFLQVYAEASAADSDSDSDADDGDQSSASTSSASLPGANAALAAPAPRLPPPGTSASADELRQWVAAVVAQSAARAGNPRASVRTSSSGESSQRSSRRMIASNDTDIPGVKDHDGQEVGLSRQGPAAYPPAPSPPQQPLQTALTPTGGRTPATAPPRGAGSSSNINNRGGSSRDAGASVPGFNGAVHQTSGGGTGEAAGKDGGGVRRYTVRYSSAASKPVFLQMSPAGAQAVSGSSSSPAASEPHAGTAAPSGGSWLRAPPVVAPSSAAASAAAADLAPAAAAAAAAPPPPPQKQSISPNKGHVSPQSPPSPSFPPTSASATISAAAGTQLGADRSSPSVSAEWRRASPPAAIVPPSREPQSARPSQTPSPQQQLILPPAAAGTAPSTSATTTDTNDAPPSSPAVPAVPSSPRDPNAELRATIFPESLTSTNPYTLYDMPLPPLPLRESWRTAAERMAAAATAGAAATPAAPPLGGAAAGPSRAERPRDLVFVTAEVAPWSKTGGLGDVMGALPRALAARGHRVMVVSPRYLSPSTADRYKGLTDTGVRASLDLGPSRHGGGGVHQVDYFHAHKDGVDWVFVDHMSYHREGTPYGNAHGTYGDNLFRFSLLCLAACEAPLLLNIGGHHRGTPPGLPYGQDVTFVANDWHAGLVSVYVAAKYRKHGVFTRARCVLALHNLAHQGAHPPHCFGSLGLPREWYGALEWVQTPGAGGAQATGNLDRIPTINILKAALVTSDRLVTVSPAYAWEITAGQGEPGEASKEIQRAGAAGKGAPTGRGGCGNEDHGMGLGSLLQQRAADLSGIVNGIDTSEWDPRTDPYLPRNYHEGSLGGKGLCKAALQGALHLPVDPAAPVVGFIGRLDYQKGPDLVLQVLPKLVAAGCQVVLLGSGAPDYEEAFRAAAVAFPANVRAHVGFSVPLSHRILAAADILLMPSRFEPCGLNQLYAMRYGTIPVAHGTGGLRDTIDDVKPFLGEVEREGPEDLDELFATGLAWGRRTPSRSADDPSTNNADYYQPFQDFFGSSGRYGPVDEEDDMYGVDQRDDSDDDLPAWRRGLQGLHRSHDPGTGWTFAPASCEALLDAVTAALVVYENHPDKWRRIQLAGMRRDFSWNRAARQWEAVMEGTH